MLLRLTAHAGHAAAGQDRLEGGFLVVVQSWAGEAGRQGRPWVLAVAGGDSCEAISGVLFSLLSVNGSLGVPRFNPGAAQLSSGSPSFKGCCLFVVYVGIVYLLLLCVQGKIDSPQLQASLVPCVLDLCQENITKSCHLISLIVTYVL